MSGRPGLPRGRVPGVAAVAGDTVLPATLVGPAGQVVRPSAGGTTSLRSWTADPALSPYRLVSGRAPVAPGEIVVDRHAAQAGGLNVGSRVTLLLPLRTQHVTVVGIALVDGAAAVASGDLMLAAARAVQSAAGDGDTWQELWVRAAPGLTAATLAGFTVPPAPPAGWPLGRPWQRRNSPLPGCAAPRQRPDLACSR